MPGRHPLMPPLHPRNAYHFWVMDNTAMINESKQGTDSFSTTAGRLWSLVEDRSKWQRQAERDKRRFRGSINAAADVQPDEEIGADQNMDEVVHLDEEFFDEQLSDAEEQFSEDDDDQQDEGFAGDHLLDGDWHPDEIFEIERIVDHRFTNTGMQFFTKWIGYPDDQNTWEPHETFNDYPELIAQYAATMPRFVHNQVHHVNEHPFPHAVEHHLLGEILDEYDAMHEALNGQLFDLMDEDNFEDVNDGQFDDVDLDQFENIDEDPVQALIGYHFGFGDEEDLDDQPIEDKENLPDI